MKDLCPPRYCYSANNYYLCEVLRNIFTNKNKQNLKIMSCFLCNSSLGKKLVMSVTGCCLVLFLLFHMSMNLVAIISPEGYNMVCEFLGANR